VARKRDSRMFHLVTDIWNPITGCEHLCCYCWARELVERRLKYSTKKYRGGFRPKLHPDELNATFKSGDFVFVADMGDMFGDFVPDHWILKVLNVVSKHPETTFLFLTKNPRRYWVMKIVLRTFRNAVFGATIETDDDRLYAERRISSAPSPSERIEYMRSLRFLRRMVSVEPIIKFTPKFWEHIVDIEPEFVYVGYDNWRCLLPEPRLDETLELIDRLREHGITVYEKTIRRAWWE